MIKTVGDLIDTLGRALDSATITRETKIGIGITAHLAAEIVSGAPAAVEVATNLSTDEFIIEIYSENDPALRPAKGQS